AGARAPGSRETRGLCAVSCGTRRLIGPRRPVAAGTTGLSGGPFARAAAGRGAVDSAQTGSIGRRHGEILMHWPTALFIAAVAIVTATELWLAARQIAAVRAHRDRIPGPFAGQLSAEDHRKAADYTAAKVRVGTIGALISAALTLALTIGGGIAAIDALWRHTGWREPWLGLAVIATVAGVMAIVSLPLSLIRTFRIEARFGKYESAKGAG